MSVGLYAFRREFVPAGQSIKVNNQTFQGPINVLRNGQVREVSIVTLGADPRTSSKFFELLDGDADMKTIEQLTAEVAELTSKLTGHDAALSAARAEGAAAERDRIKAVKAQALAGQRPRAVAGLAAHVLAVAAELNCRRALSGRPWLKWIKRCIHSMPDYGRQWKSPLVIYPNSMKDRLNRPVGKWR